MGNAFSFAFEDKLIIFIQQYMSEAMVKIAGIITEFGDQLVLVAILGLFYWSLNKKLGKKMVVYLSFVNIVYPCLKSTFRRLRPYMANHDIKCLKPVNKEGDIYDVVTQEFSFPSGHASNSIVLYGTLGKNSKSKTLKIILAILVLLVGVSRFALGVHYPTDVLVGWIVGSICVAVYKFIEKKLGRNKAFAFVDIIGLAGFFIAKTNDFYTGYGMLLGATLGILFEEKYVNFEETKKPLACIFRTVIGAGLYLGLNELFKMPFSAEFLGSGTTAAFCVRALRYAVNSFLLLGVYPMSFKLFKKSEPAEQGLVK